MLNPHFLLFHTANIPDHFKPHSFFPISKWIKNTHEFRACNQVCPSQGRKCWFSFPLAWGTHSNHRNFTRQLQAGWFLCAARAKHEVLYWGSSYLFFLVIMRTSLKRKKYTCCLEVLLEKSPVSSTYAVNSPLFTNHREEETKGNGWKTRK